MRVGIFSFRAFDRRLARLAVPISSGVRQGGGQNMPPSRARSAEYPSGARVKEFRLFLTQVVGSQVLTTEYETTPLVVGSVISKRSVVPVAIIVHSS